MSLSRSPMCTQRSGCASTSLDCLRFSNHRKLSFSSMGRRADFFFFSAVVPSCSTRLQNLIAHSPRGKPSGVSAKLECIKTPHFLPEIACPFLRTEPPLRPTDSGSSRMYENSVVSCKMSSGPDVACARSRLAWKCPARMACSSTRSLSKNRYAAFVLAKSWQASGTVRPTPSPSTCRRLFNLLPNLASRKLQPPVSSAIQFALSDGLSTPARLFRLFIGPCHGQPCPAGLTDHHAKWWT